MSTVASIMKTQKPLAGLLVIGVMLLTGAGCASVDDVESQVATATIAVEEKVTMVQATIERMQQTYEKVKAIYEILNPDSPTPSVPPTEDQPQPAAEESTSSQ